MMHKELRTGIPSSPLQLCRQQTGLCGQQTGLLELIVLNTHLFAYCQFFPKATEDLQITMD